MALKILHCMSSIGVEPDQISYTTLINSLCKMGRPEQACVFLGLIVKKGVPVDEVTLTTLIHGYCKMGKSRYALMLLEQMVEDGCLTSPHAFNVFLEGEGKLVEGNALLGKMLKHGLVPSVVTYTVLVDGLRRAGDTTASLKMLEVMKEGGCSPNVYTYTVAIDVLCQSGKLEEAENLVVEMCRAGVSPNAITYTLLIKWNVAARRMERAFELVGTMLKEGCRPNIQIYRALLCGIVALESGEVDRHRIEKFGDDVFMEMGVHHGLQLVSRMRECGGEAYEFVMVGLRKAGRISEAALLESEHVRNAIAYIGFPEEEKDQEESSLQILAFIQQMGCKTKD